MKKTMTIFLLGLCVLIIQACSVSKNPPKTAEKVDIVKYMGSWHEIASFPNSFQDGCRYTKAAYTYKESYVSVFNTCIKDNKLSSVKGKAWVVEGSQGSRLKVQFFWPFKGDYWILYVDKDYQMAIVGEPTKEYLWILAREPIISATDYKYLLGIATARGYDVSKLKKTDQHM